MGEHYVYLYRDRNGTPIYVGYGRHALRATSHQSSSHNRRLESFLRMNGYTLEIAGPFGSAQQGLAVETALISGFRRPKFNVQKGPTKWRFRPLGVPEHLAGRIAEQPLTRRAMLRRCRLVSRIPFVFVHITSEKLDGRKGYDLARPPTDRQILERMDRKWRLGRFIEHWRSGPAASPGILVGIHGRPGEQVIIGAVRINWKGWTTIQPRGGYFRFPTLPTKNLDALELRGRRIAASAGIRFGSWDNQFVVRLDRNGRVTGGYPK